MRPKDVRRREDVRRRTGATAVDSHCRLCSPICVRQSPHPIGERCVTTGARRLGCFIRNPPGQLPTTRYSPPTMEWLALITLLGVALPAAGDVFESTVDSASTRLSFQCTKVTVKGCRKSNPELEVVLNSLVASFNEGTQCVLKESVAKSYKELTDYYNDNCLKTPIKTTFFRLEMSQVTEEAIQSACPIGNQRLTKLTVNYECVSQSSISLTSTQTTAARTAASSEGSLSSRLESGTAVYTMPPAITSGSSSPKAETPLLPVSSLILLSPSTLGATSTTTNDKAAFTSATSHGMSSTWSKPAENTKIQVVTSSVAATTTAGRTVTWRIDNSARTTPTVADGMLNQSHQTEKPANGTDLSPKAVASKEEWWYFFKTKEGIAVAVAALLLICLTICGLALMFCSRSKTDSKSSRNTLPSGAFVPTAAYNGQGPNAKKQGAEPVADVRANLYVDAPGYRRPSSRPSSAFGASSQPQLPANGWNFVNEPMASFSPGSFRDEPSDHYAAIGDATEMLRPVEERRASAHRPSVAGVRRPSAMEMASNPSAGRALGGMFSIDEEDGDRSTQVPPTRQAEYFRPDVTQQFPPNAHADYHRRTSQYLPRMSWSTSAGPQNATPGYQFPVPINRRVSEMSMNTPM